MENNTQNTNTAVSHEVTIFAEPIFSVGNFTVTNSVITSWLTLIVITVLALAIRLKIKKIPGKLQNFFEIIMDGALSLCDQVTGDRKISKKVFPFSLTLFFFILISNWLGLVPFLGSLGFTSFEGGNAAFVPLFRSATADINTTLALSIVVVIASNIFGIFMVGLWKTFNKYVNLISLGSVFTKVKKDPTVLIVAPINFFVGVLELVGEMAKIASLSFRLFGNVFAGEVLLASMGAIMSYLVPAPFLFLEVFVGLIQAVVFSLLATVYFAMAAQDHTEHEEKHSEAHA
ncbi:MAG: F0F1 ATP synthase subunit A [Minisyncoccia bacterium]